MTQAEKEQFLHDIDARCPISDNVANLTPIELVADESCCHPNGAHIRPHHGQDVGRFFFLSPPGCSARPARGAYTLGHFPGLNCFSRSCNPNPTYQWLHRSRLGVLRVAYATDVLQLPPEQVGSDPPAPTCSRTPPVWRSGQRHARHGHCRQRWGGHPAPGDPPGHPGSHHTRFPGGRQGAARCRRVKVEYTRRQAPCTSRRAWPPAPFGEVIIAGDYDCVTRVCADGRVIYQAPQVEDAGNAARIQQFDLAEILRPAGVLRSRSPGNSCWRRPAPTARAAHTALGQDDITYRKVYNSIPLRQPGPLAWMAQAQRWTVAACEGRMGGLAMPVMALGGSGNQGITAFLGLTGAGPSYPVPPGANLPGPAFPASHACMIKSYMDRLKRPVRQRPGRGPGGRRRGGAAAGRQLRAGRRGGTLGHRRPQRAVVRRRRPAVPLQSQRRGRPGAPGGLTWPCKGSVPGRAWGSTPNPWKRPLPTWDASTAPWRKPTRPSCPSWRNAPCGYRCKGELTKRIGARGRLVLGPGRR